MNRTTFFSLLTLTLIFIAACENPQSVTVTPRTTSDFALLTPVDSSTATLDSTQSLTLRWNRPTDMRDTLNLRYTVVLGRFSSFDSGRVYSKELDRDTLLALSYRDFKSIPVFESGSEQRLYYSVFANDRVETLRSVNVFLLTVRLTP